jgi:hypothetical protein
MPRDIEDVGADKRFAARDHEEAALVDLSNLINQLVTLFRREFIVPAGGFRRRIEITMIALEIAALRKIQCDEVGFEVIDRSAIVRRSSHRWRAKELRDLLLDIAECARVRRGIENWKQFTHSLEECGILN